jgi:hypothetical protein
MATLDAVINLVPGISRRGEVDEGDVEEGDDGDW